MGFLKNRQIELDEGAVDDWAVESMSVCARCIANEDLSDLIDDDEPARRCTFCGRFAKVTPLVDVAERINDSVRRLYESDQGGDGFGGPGWTTQELLEEQVGIDLPYDRSGKLMDALCGALGERDWRRRNYLGLDEDEHLVWSWEEFCEKVRGGHVPVFRVLEETEDSEWEPMPSCSTDEALSPEDMLDRIGRYSVRHGIAQILPSGRVLFRAHRPDPRRRFISALDFGPPPPEDAPANRMSPAGEVMFYGCGEESTARLEVGKDDDEASKCIVGEFRTIVDVPIVDLTAWPEPPGFFQEYWEDREELLFLRRFADDVSKRIEIQSEADRIEYKPTQVMTNYFRTMMRHQRLPVMGVRYKSSEDGKPCYVLFIDRTGVRLNDEDVARLTDAESARYAAGPQILEFSRPHVRE